MLEIIQYLVLALISAGACFVPGYVIARGFTRLKDEELVLASLAAGIFLLGMSEFFAYLLNVSQPLFNAFAFVIVSALGLVFLYLTGKAKVAIEPRPIYLAVFSVFVLVLALQSIVPVYTGAYWFGDWWMHYDVGRLYVDHAPTSKTWFPQNYTPTSRTPLFDLAGAFFVALYSGGFWVFQISSSFLLTIFLLPLFMLTRKLFSERAAWLAIILTLFSPMVLTNEMYTWPKLLLAFFVLSMLYFYLDLRTQIRDRHLSGHALPAVAFFAALAYLTHQTSLFYILAVFLDALILLALSFKRLGFELRFQPKYALIALLLFFAVLAPWHAWAFSTYGVEKTLKSSPAISDAFTSKDWATDHELSALASVAPVFQHEWYTKWFATPDDFFKTVQCPGFPCKAALYSVTIRFWFDTVPGGLTLSVFFALICLLAYRICTRGISLHYTTNAFLAFLLVVVFLLATVTMPMLDTKGWGSPMYLPAMMIIIGIAGAGLASLGRYALLLVLGGALAEFITIKVSHLYVLATGQLAAFETWNTALVTDNHLIMAYDYLGGWRLLLALGAIILFAYLLLFLRQQVVKAKRGN